MNLASITIMLKIGCLIYYVELDYVFYKLEGFLCCLNFQAFEVI